VEVNGEEATKILWDVLAANSSMHAAAQCVKLVEEQLEYPITSVNHLIRVVERHADESGRLSVGSCRISKEDVRRRLQPHYFPIEGRQALISVLLAAFESDRLRQMTSSLGSSSPT
jgi:hypothetical protein